MRYKTPEWSDERLRRLAELWPDPTYSIVAIARELGTNREAVKRRAKYLDLQGRPMNGRERWLAARRELLRTIGRKETMP
jgi:hypothetical protein